jgi:hypothetical protein
VIVETFNMLGASPTPMPVGEIYNGLQQGVIDGAENAPLFVEAMKHYEVAKYFSETNHFIIPDFLFISLKTWNRLTPALQASLQEATVEMQKWEFDAWDKAEALAVTDLEAHGMKFNKVDIPSFRDRRARLTAIERPHVVPSRQAGRSAGNGDDQPDHRRHLHDCAAAGPFPLCLPQPARLDGGVGALPPGLADGHRCGRRGADGAAFPP